MANVVLVPIGGGADDSQMIQNAIDGVEAQGGGVVRLTCGTYYLGPSDSSTPPSLGAYSLKLGDNMHLSLDVDAVVVRRFNALGKANASIRNKNFAGNTNIRVTGGSLLTIARENEGMNVCFVTVLQVSIDNVTINGGAGTYSAFLQDCSNVNVSNLTINGGDQIAEDGLHISGGSRITITNCQIVSGDDALALVNSPTIDQTTDLTDVAVSNCYLRSRKANAIKLVVDTDAGHIIRRVAISNIVAKCGGEPAGGGGIFIHNFDTAGSISEVEIDGVILDASQNVSAGIWVKNANRVRLSRVSVYQPSVRSEIDGCGWMELVDCNIIGTRETSPVQQILLVAENNQCDYFKIIGGQYETCSQHGIALGGASSSVTNFQILNAYVSGAANSGIFVGHAFNGIICGNRVVACGGRGIEEFNLSANNIYSANHTQGNFVSAILLPGTTGSRKDITTTPQSLNFE